MAKTKKSNPYDVVKFFKEIYTRINSSTSLFFIGKENNFIMENNNPFIISYGSLPNEGNDFLEWALNKKFRVQVQDIMRIKEILKKNLISINSSETSFEIKFKDKDDNTRNIVFEITNESLLLEDKIQTLENKIDANTKNTIKTETIGEKFTFKSAGVKILEIPSKFILDLKQDSIEVSYSKLENFEYRIVLLETKSDTINLKEIFYSI